MLTIPAHVSLTAQRWSATNAPTGRRRERDLRRRGQHRWTSLLYAYNPRRRYSRPPRSTVHNPANGAPAGIRSRRPGQHRRTSIVYAYNPSSTATQTASFYSASDRRRGTAGTLTGETIDYAAGQTYNGQTVGLRSRRTPAPARQLAILCDRRTGSAVGSPVITGNAAAAQTIGGGSAVAAGWHPRFPVAGWRVVGRGDDEIAGSTNRSIPEPEIIQSSPRGRIVRHLGGA